MKKLNGMSFTRNSAAILILTTLTAVMWFEDAGAQQRVPVNSLRGPIKTKQSWVQGQQDATESEKPVAKPVARPATNPTQPAAAESSSTDVQQLVNTRTRQPAKRSVRQVVHNTRAPMASKLSQAFSAAPRQPSRQYRGPAPMHRVQQTSFIEAYHDGCDSCGSYICDGQCGGGYEPSCGIDSCGGCGDSCGIGCGCGGCAESCCTPCNPFGWWDWRRTEIFVGVQGFKGPPNFAGTGNGAQREGSGSFGFHQGFNFGRPLYLIGRGELGWQFGLRATQSNLSGAEFTNDERTQLFLTGGVFRRVDLGLQWGVAVDYLSDQWYYDVNLLQIRPEVSWKVAPNNEYGFRFSLSTQSSSSIAEILDDTGATTFSDSAFQATDQYRFFHRRTLRSGVIAEVNAGFSGNSDVLLGTNFSVPLSGNLGLRTGVDYLIPDEGASALGNQQESWNLGLSLVWYPCGRMCGGNDYFRPMFDVADNGSFMLDRR